MKVYAVKMYPDSVLLCRCSGRVFDTVIEEVEQFHKVTLWDESELEELKAFAKEHGVYIFELTITPARLIDEKET